MGKLSYVHERRAERHYIVLRITTERAVSFEGDGSWESIGSCDASITKSAPWGFLGHVQ